MNGNSNSSIIIPSLTGLRAIAAYMVFLHHSPILFLQFPSFDIQRELHIGVTVFFVLSGFLITYRYQDSYTFNRKWLFQYFLNRFARIFPVYLLITIFSLFYLMESDFFIWIINLTLVKGFFDEFKFSITPQAWSLTVEECFYFLAPILFMLFDKKKTFIHLLIFLSSLLGAVLLIGNKVDYYSFLSPVRFVLLYTFFGRFFEFITGMYLAKILTNKIPSPLIANYLKHKTMIGCGGILIVLVGLALLKSNFYEYGLYHPLGVVLNNLILPVFIALLIWGLTKEETVFSKILSTSLFGLLGKSSYVFYLIHFGIIYKLTSFYFSNKLSVFIVLNIFSIIIYKYYEKPLNKAIRSAVT